MLPWFRAHSRQILLQSPKGMLGGRKHSPHPHHKMPWRAGCSQSCREGCPVADTPTPSSQDALECRLQSVLLGGLSHG